MGVKKIISGGQSGVDRAALDAAMALDMDCGGWCPKGRWAEDGPIDDRYPLRETTGDDPAERTRLNVRDADGTLIIARRPLTGGTALTRQIATELGRPCLVVDPASSEAPAKIRQWLKDERVEILNIAGPRASQRPPIYEEARNLLVAVWAAPDA